MYEMVDFEGHKIQPDINVLLTTSVEGIGEKGDVVSMRPNAAYNKVLLPGFGTYSQIKADETKERLVSETFNAKRVSRLAFNPKAFGPKASFTDMISPLSDRQHAEEPSSCRGDEQGRPMDPRTVARASVSPQDGRLHQRAGH